MLDQKWDGVTQSYVPGKTLKVHPTLQLHSEYDEDIDPIEYEVIRHTLWSINDDHGVTISRISGSPIIIYTHDFNPAILTEDAQFVYFGPYLQYHGGVMDTVVKWTMENRSEQPGINDGDMFFCNDPWIGAPHQNDTCIMAPVFWKEKLFCWVTNVAHQADMGGTTPGSFCPDANDVFDEGLPIPTMKIMENGKIINEVDELLRRTSRMPKVLGLDIRAQIGGASFAKQRILQLLERYGPKTVKGVMRKVIKDGKKDFTSRLASIPDGTWRERAFIDISKTGDRKTYKVELTLTKKGDKLIFSNEGTEGQTGSINITYAGWRGATLAALSTMMCYSQLGAIGGAAEHIEFNPVSGTLTCANFPAAVSQAGIVGNLFAIAVATNVIAKMLSSSEQTKSDVMTVGGCSTWPLNAYGGLDKLGQEVAAALPDPMGGAIGAFSFRDGVSTGGHHWIPKAKAPNVEFHEQFYPMLYLYKQEVANSGGAGKYRGGNSAKYGFIPHDTEELIQVTSSSGAALPTGLGIFGGKPGAVNEYRYKVSTNIIKRFEEKDIPRSIDDIDGEFQQLHPRQVNIVQGKADILETRWTAGAGYGDPLDRETSMVVNDLNNGEITIDVANSIYGVIANVEKGVWVEAPEETLKQRQKIIQERLKRGRKILQEAGQ